MRKRKKILVSIFAIFLVIVFLFTFIVSVVHTKADNLSQQLSNAQNARKAAEQELADIQSQKRVAENDKNRIDGEIAALNTQIQTAQAEISATDLVLQEKEAELHAAEVACDNQFRSFKTRARIMYENGPTTYIGIIFSSGSFSEFFSNIQVVKSLLDYDNKLLEERKAVREVIAAQKSDVEALRAEQLVKHNTLSEMKATLYAKQQAQSAIVAQLEGQEKLLKERVEAQIAEEERIQKMIADAVAAQKAAELAAQQAAEQAAQQGSSTTVSVITTTGTGAMQWPCPSTKYVTSEFGTRSQPVAGASSNHKGIDIGAAMGADVVAADSGTVLFSGNSSSYGKYIVITHGNGVTTLYAHCSELLVKAGATVTKGQTIAKVGSTGISSGPHLHFEVSVNGVRQNPKNYVS